ncbi:MAG TPA: hypothetical protein PKD83_07520 [Ignavibacteria bacterium]|nr:hypothetical protein [Ignavibacteria bacterium]
MENDLKKIIDEYFENSNYKLVELVIRGEKGTKVAEIFADSREGVNIDELAKINRDLNELVDLKLQVKELSKLVVSSPGTERSFRYLWQIEKHIGRTLEIEMNDGEKIEGKLEKIENGDKGIIFLEILKKEKGKKLSSENRAIEFNIIKESRVKISFKK